MFPTKICVAWIDSNVVRLDMISMQIAINKYSQIPVINLLFVQATWEKHRLCGLRLTGTFFDHDKRGSKMVVQILEKELDNA